MTKPDDQVRRRDVALSRDASGAVARAPGRATPTSRLPPSADAVAQRVFRLMRKAEGANDVSRDANGVADGAESAVASAGGSGGSALPGDVRAKFEGSLGADLSGVRVHTGANSAAAADAVGARAYTVGQDIHFGAGQYAPSDPFGMHLLAHEVAHTVQQSGGSAPAGQAQFKLEVSTPGDAHELEADRAADAMVSGAAANISSASGMARQVIQRDAETDPDAANKKSDHLVDFDDEVSNAKLHFTGIAKNQQAAVIGMKTAAGTKDAPNFGEEMLIGIVSAAIGYALPGIGDMMAKAVANRLRAGGLEKVFSVGAQLAEAGVKKAFDKGTEKAKDAAKAKLTPKSNADVILRFLDTLAQTYPELAATHYVEFGQKMAELKKAALRDASPGTAEAAKNLAHVTAAALQENISNTAQPTKDGAFSGLSDLLRHNSVAQGKSKSEAMDGTMIINIRVNDSGHTVDGIDRIRVNGVPDAMLKEMSDAGRPLSAYRMTRHIKATYHLANAPSITTPGHKQVSFEVLVDSNNTAIADMQSEDNNAWLKENGNGDAWAGAQKLFNDIKDHAVTKIEQG